MLVQSYLTRFSAGNVLGGDGVWKLERYEVINAVLEGFKQPSYLEIGVDQGVTFGKVVAGHKVGVDIRFAFDFKAMMAQPENAHCKLIEESSDGFFLENKGRDKFDVIFVDGLHTYEQTLRDLMNSWSVLKPGGVIIVDDIMPSSYAASIPDLSIARTFWEATRNPDGAWMGDVYRLAFFIEAFMPAFSYAMVAENHGQLVMWMEQRPAVLTRSLASIAQMQYVDAVLNAGTFHVAPFEAIRQRLAAREI